MRTVAAGGHFTCRCHLTTAADAELCIAPVRTDADVGNLFPVRCERLLDQSPDGLGGGRAGRLVCAVNRPMIFNKSAIVRTLIASLSTEGRPRPRLDFLARFIVDDFMILCAPRSRSQGRARRSIRGAIARRSRHVAEMVVHRLRDVGFVIWPVEVPPPPHAP